MPMAATRGGPSTQESPEQWLDFRSVLHPHPAPWPPSPSPWLRLSGSSILLSLGCCFQQVGWGLLAKGCQLSSLSRFQWAPQSGSLRRPRLICLEPRPSETPAQTGESIFLLPGPRDSLANPYRLRSSCWRNTLAADSLPCPLFTTPLPLGPTPGLKGRERGREGRRKGGSGRKEREREGTKRPQLVWPRLYRGCG